GDLGYCMILVWSVFGFGDNGFGLPDIRFIGWSNALEAIFLVFVYIIAYLFEDSILYSSMIAFGLALLVIYLIFMIGASINFALLSVNFYHSVLVLLRLNLKRKRKKRGAHQLDMIKMISSCGFLRKPSFTFAECPYSVTKFVSQDFEWVTNGFLFRIWCKPFNNEQYIVNFTNMPKRYVRFEYLNMLHT
ncbi:hypothetical protein ACJX0J_013576, partial [Zea mays]